MDIGLRIAINFYAISFIILLVLGILSWFIWDRRFKSKQSVVVPPGFHKTDEVFIDPTTNRKISVYYNPITAERFYKDEN